MNYFGRVEQDDLYLNSSAMFSQPANMQQAMPMNDLCGRSNSDSSANYFEQSYTTPIIRTEVIPNNYPTPCTVASGFHSAHYVTSYHGRMKQYTGTYAPPDNTLACSVFIARKLF